MQGIRIDQVAEEAVRGCLSSGKSLRKTAAECGVSTGVVQRVLRNLKSEGVVGASEAGGSDIEARLQAIIAQFVSEVRGSVAKPEVVPQAPQKFAVEPRTRVVDLGRKYERIAVISDLHHPFQDDAAIDCSLAAIRDFRPDLFVILGDYFDCYSISAHDKEPGRADHLQDEFDAARPTHRKIDDVAGDAPTIFLDGNHEQRIQRTQAVNPGLFKLRSMELPVAADLPKRWLYYPNQTRFKAGPLSLLHGDLKGRGTSSMHAAKGMLDKLRTSCLFGHLHRFQTFHQTGDDGSVRGGFANGHLCDTAKAHYITNPDWQQGFSTIEFDWASGVFSVAPHLIVRGRHRWNGKTYGAAPLPKE